MKIELFLDRNNKPIDTEKTYKDIINNVSDIHIVERNRFYFAKPDGLDAEPLEEVCRGLVIQEWGSSI